MNEPLRDELLSMEAEDRRLLMELIEQGELAQGQAYHPRLKAMHEKHNARIKELIREHGWPGFSLVGKEGSKAAWLIVQHAVLDTGFMEHSLALLRRAVKNGEAEAWCVAYLQDRILAMAGKPQVYGTQHGIDGNGVAYPLPMAAPERVEALRKEVGLEPLHEATKRIQERHKMASSKGRGA